MAPSSTLSMSHVPVTPSLFASLGRPNSSNRLSANQLTHGGTADISNARIRARSGSLTHGGTADIINARIRARSGSKLLGSVDSHMSSGAFTKGSSKCSNADAALLRPRWKSSRPSSVGGTARPRISTAAAAAAVFGKADTAGDLLRFSPGFSNGQQDQSTAVRTSILADSKSTLEDNGSPSDPGQANGVRSVPKTGNDERGGAHATTTCSLPSISASQSGSADRDDHTSADLASERSRACREELQPVAIDMELSELARKIKDMEVACRAVEESSRGLGATTDQDLADNQGLDAAGPEAVGSNSAAENACEEQRPPQPTLEMVVDEVTAPPCLNNSISLADSNSEHETREVTATATVPLLYLSPDDWLATIKTLSGRCSQPEVFSDAPSQTTLDAEDSLADLAKKIKDMDMVCQGLNDTDATATLTEAVEKLDELLPPQDSMKPRKKLAAESLNIAVKSAEKSALEAVRCPRLDMAMESARKTAVGEMCQGRSISKKRVRICEEAEKIDVEDAHSSYSDIDAVSRLELVDVDTEMCNDLTAFDRACQGQAVADSFRVDANAAQEIPEVDSEMVDDMVAFETVWQAQVSMEPSFDKQLSEATCVEADNGETASLRDAN